MRLDCLVSNCLSLMIDLLQLLLYLDWLALNCLSIQVEAPCRTNLETRQGIRKTTPSTSTLRKNRPHKAVFVQNRKVPRLYSTVLQQFSKEGSILAPPRTSMWNSGVEEFAEKGVHFTARICHVLILPRLLSICMSSRIPHSRRDTSLFSWQGPASNHSSVDEIGPRSLRFSRPHTAVFVQKRKLPRS